MPSLASALLPVLALIGLTGCMQMMASSGPVEGCELMRPITWSEADTATTVRQIKLHNAVWSGMCGPASKSFIARSAGLL